MTYVSVQKVICRHIVTYFLLTRRIISGFWMFMLGLLDISSGGVYNYLLQSQSHCNHTALILHRLTPYILLPQLFTAS
jgi:hypothetical protein